MMKLKKEQFKKILKECIVELIKDGAFDEIVLEGVQKAAASGDIINESKTKESQNHLKEVSRMAANLISHGDKNRAAIMASIFEDTAKTTLQTVLAEEGGGNGLYVGLPPDPEQDKMDKAQLDLLSGGMTSRWAAAAFANKK